MKPLLFIFLLLWNLATVQAQYNAPQNKVWAMSRYAGLDFSNGAPVFVSTAIQGIPYYEEGCASVADAQANLLFYTNGQQVWRANGAIMLNGNDLLPGTTATSLSSAQGCLIVPDPGNDRRYYIFSITTEVYPRKLYCNLVDMQLDNGNGAVDTTFPLRNIVLRDSVSEKMIAVGGCEKLVWVLLRHAYQARFEAFSVTPLGVNLQPVVSPAINTPVYRHEVGTLKISNNKSRLLNCNYGGGLELYNFNYSTGMVSPGLLLDTSYTTSYYGGAFSADDSKVYASSLTTNQIYQFDLNTTLPYLTKTAIGPSASFFTDMRLGPDGKIYFPSPVNFNIGDGSKYVGRINFPGNTGSACGYQDSVTSLYFQPDTAAIKAGLPNPVVMPPVLYGDVAQVALDTVICAFNGPLLLAVPSGFSDYVWDNNATGHVRFVTQRGTFWVTRTNHCGETLIDTFKVRGAALTAPVIVQNNNTLSTAASYASYQWYKDGAIIPGATNATLYISQQAWYAVMAGNIWGCKDSTGIAAGPLTAINDPAMLRNSISVHPNPTAGMIKITAPVPLSLSLVAITGKVLVEQHRTNSLDITCLAPGLYFLKIMDQEGHLIKTEKVGKQ